ncbi:glutamic acid-rich protein isoform X2 [Patella vulgata]|uniref:glutamic acid-rich protein isoform X2 n=1 Tax=Patella vulgata TaxID=6465 RepID=UPI0024A821B5|nr:glutamic acid-rich protein isoform X2 [Patella vulgata]
MYRGNERYGHQGGDQVDRRYDERDRIMTDERDNRRNDRRSSNEGYDSGSRDSRRSVNRRVEMELLEERERKHKMAEELRIREQQLAMTSSLLEKQSMMLQNLESNIMAQNVKPHPGNMMPMGNMNQNMRMNQQFRGPMNHPMDGPSPAKRFRNDQFQGGSRNDAGPEGRGDRQDNRNKSLAKRKCYVCDKFGHLAKDCKSKIDRSSYPNKPNNISRSPQSKPLAGGKSLETCFKCGEKGHFFRDCRKRKSDLGSKPDDKSETTKGPGRFSDMKPFKKPEFKRQTFHQRNPNTCRLCVKTVSEWQKHLKDPEHMRISEICRKGCKVCAKKRFNTIFAYNKHQDSPLHRALINKKKQVIESKINPYSAEKVTGVEYVVPVTGFFCKLCKKFYNKEQYAKVQHCQTKAHYEQVSAVIGSKYETAVGAKFAELSAKVTKDNKKPSQLDRQIIEAVRKADFVTGIKPIKPVVKPKPENGAGDKKKEVKPDAESEATTPADDKTKTETTDATEDNPESATEKHGTPDRESEDEGSIHPDDLEMEVLDAVDEDQDEEDKDAEIKEEQEDKEGQEDTEEQKDTEEQEDTEVKEDTEITEQQEETEDKE